MGAGIHAAFVPATVITEVSTFVQFAIFILARTKKTSRRAAFPLTSQQRSVASKFLQCKAGAAQQAGPSWQHFVTPAIFLKPLLCSCSVSSPLPLPAEGEFVTWDKDELCSPKGSSWGLKIARHPARDFRFYSGKQLCPLQAPFGTGCPGSALHIQKQFTIPAAELSLTPQSQRSFQPLFKQSFAFFSYQWL